MLRKIRSLITCPSILGREENRAVNRREMKASRVFQIISHTVALLALTSLLALNARAQTTKGAVMAESQSDPKQSVKDGKSTIKGRVVFDDTGRPVRRAQVMLINPNNLGSPPSAVTDGRGEFHLKKVAAGRYYVIVEAPGLLSSMAFRGEDE